jgi:hypothetical protein
MNKLLLILLLLSSIAQANLGTFKDGSLADEQGFLNKKIIDSIIS